MGGAQLVALSMPHAASPGAALSGAAPPSAALSGAAPRSSSWTRSSSAAAHAVRRSSCCTPATTLAPAASAAATRRAYSTARACSAAISAISRRDRSSASSSCRCSSARMTSHLAEEAEAAEGWVGDKGVERDNEVERAKGVEALSAGAPCSDARMATEQCERRGGHQRCPGEQQAEVGEGGVVGT